MYERLCLAIDLIYHMKNKLRNHPRIIYVLWIAKTDIEFVTSITFICMYYLRRQSSCSLSTIDPKKVKTAYSQQ